MSARSGSPREGDGPTAWLLRLFWLALLGAVVHGVVLRWLTAWGGEAGVRAVPAALGLHAAFALVLRSAVPLLAAVLLAVPGGRPPLVTGAALVAATLGAGIPALAGAAALGAPPATPAVGVGVLEAVTATATLSLVPALWARCPWCSMAVALAALTHLDGAAVRFSGATPIPGTGALAAHSGLADALAALATLSPRLAGAPASPGTRRRRAPERARPSDGVLAPLTRAAAWGGVAIGGFVALMAAELSLSDTLLAAAGAHATGLAWVGAIAVWSTRRGWLPPADGRVGVLRGVAYAVTFVGAALEIGATARAGARGAPSGLARHLTEFDGLFTAAAVGSLVLTAGAALAAPTMRSATSPPRSEPEDE